MLQTFFQNSTQQVLTKYSAQLQKINSIGNLFSTFSDKQLQEKTLELKKKLEDTISGEDELTIRTELVGGMGKYGRLLGWLYIGEDTVSLNEQMITEGYAWEYDGGTKKKDFEELREIRRSFGTLDEG